MKTAKNLMRKMFGISLVIIILMWQVVFAGAPFIQNHLAQAAPVCTVDTAGANDEPGQKDLTQLCVDYSNIPTSVATTWNWDQTGTNGANSMDACNLFDTDGDGNINYAVCVDTKNDPAQFQSTTTYSCGDDKIDRCTSPNAVIPNGGTTCAVSQVTNDPFPTGASAPKDTQGACTIDLNAVGGGLAKLVDVCSYPSAEPNSDPSDCVIAQPKAGKLTVVKNLIPAADPGLFNLQIDLTTDAANVGNNGTTGEVVVPEGNHAVSETAGTNTSLANYNSAISCRDLNGTGNVVKSGAGTSLTSIPIADGSDVVCTITNTVKQATLILQKTVINDNGGTLTQSNFPVAIGGTAAQWGSNTVSPGTYIVSETQQAGYQAGSWGGNCTAGGSVTLTPNQTATCTITNNDIAPQLTVIKHVINNNGGTAVASNFTMNVTGTNVSNPSFAGAESPGTTVTLNAGSYSVNENLAVGYSESLSADCTGSIAIGQTKTCTITNDDIAPELTVNKVVVNPYGTPLDPSAFPLFVDGISVTNGVTTNQFNAGTHTVSETQQTGYTLTGVSGDCTQSNNTISLTLSVGGHSSCTLTNTAVQPKLVVIKHVVNDNAGTKTAADFTMTVSGNSATVPNFPGNEVGVTVNLNEGSYSANELTTAGYSKSLSADCTGTIAIGQTKTCTITNNDVAPSLTLNKIVSNTHGGTAVENNWTLIATGPSTLSGPGAAGSADVVSDSTFKAGTYTLSEAGGPSGYSASNWTCTNGVTVANNQISLANAQTTVCSITNSDIAPILTVTKVVVNPYGPALDPSAFPLFVDGISVTSGVPTTQFNAGSHTVTETQQTGYTLTGVSGDCNQANNTISLTLSVGGSSTCTLTNTAVQPKVIVIKHVVNDNGGGKSASDFTMTLSGNSASVPNFPGSEAGTTVPLNEGNYTVDETSHVGYTETKSADCTGTIAIGQTKTCTITNNDIAPQLTVIKHVINDNSGTSKASDFTMTVAGTNVSSPSFAGAESPGTTVTLNAGSYSANENLAVGYDKSLSADCTGTIAIGETKTCTITNNDVAHPQIHIAKSGPATAHEGDTVTYTFTVTNTGDTNLTAIAVNDSIADAGVYQSGDSNNDTILQKTETWIYTKDFVIPTGQIADVVNTAEACGHYIYTKVCATDNHTLDVLHPMIHVDKYGPATAFEGDTVTYTFIVTNTGDTALYNIGINDDIATGETCLVNTLGIGESTSCTASYTIPTPQVGDVTNHVIASGTDSLQKTVTDTDEHTLDVLHPTIHVVKSGPGSAAAGSTVTYTFTVTNTGDVPLSNITVNDNIAGMGVYQSGDTHNSGFLDTDETWIYTAQYTIPAGQTASVNNTVTACGELVNEVELSIDRIDEQTDDSPAVCATATHTLVIPKVLAETTVAPAVLVNTGQSALAGILAGLTVLGLVAVTTYASKPRKN
jgi:uncharacterized repeat protein (TIGR01451 family)